MTGAFIKNAIIPGTISFAIQLGKLLEQQRGNVEQILPHLKTLFADSVYGECRLLFTGKVIDKNTKIIGGYDIGNATLQGFGSNSGTMNIGIKNEYLIAQTGDDVVASVPDLIVIVDFETSTPINAERLRFGQRVGVIAVGCPQFYRSNNALEVVSPRAFGFDVDYQPL